MESSKRRQLAIETSIVMFVCAAGLACVQLYRQGAEGSGYMIMVGIPASACGIFAAIGYFSSHLLNTDRIVFPYTVSLPVAFCSLLPVCSLIFATPEKGLVAPQDSLAYAHLWQQPLELAVVLFVEVLALSLYSLFPRL